MEWKEIEIAYCEKNWLHSMCHYYLLLEKKNLSIIFVLLLFERVEKMTRKSLLFAAPLSPFYLKP